MSKDTVVAVISDMQVGSTVALAPSRWNLFDGGSFHASPGQKIIHRQWVKSALSVKDMLTENRRRKRLVVILDGEPIDGNHHDTAQLISKNTQEQIEMAITLLDEWLGLAEYEPKRGDCIYLVRGTDAHESSEAIEQIGRDIDGVVPYRKDSGHINDKGKPIRDGRYHHQKLLKEVNDNLFHITHHGFGRGSRAWTTENSIHNTLKSMYFTKLDKGVAIPNYVIGAHVHKYAIATYHGTRQIVTGFTCPSWQVKTNFTYRVGAMEDLNDIGMVAVDVLESGASKVIPEFIRVEDTPISEF